MDILRSAVENRLRYWEEQLASAAIDKDDERAKHCARFVSEYTELLLAAAPSLPSPNSSPSGVPKGRGGT